MPEDTRTMVTEPRKNDFERFSKSPFNDRAQSYANSVSSTAAESQKRPRTPLSVPPIRDASVHRGAVGRGSNPLIAAPCGGDLEIPSGFPLENCPETLRGVPLI